MALCKLKVNPNRLGLGELPSRPTLTRYMEDPNLMPILTGLVTLSAVPVSPLDTRFAADSIGFGTTIHDEQWSDAKWGDAESRKAYTRSIWTKAHLLVGVRTNVVTAAYVTGSLVAPATRRSCRGYCTTPTAILTSNGYSRTGPTCRRRTSRPSWTWGGGAHLLPRDQRLSQPPDPGRAIVEWRAVVLQGAREEFDGDYDERNNVESTNSRRKETLGQHYTLKAPHRPRQRGTGPRRRLQYHPRHTHPAQ